jgi:hypothetical protein
MRRRSVAFCLSGLLHAATLAGLAARPRPESTAEGTAAAVEYVSAAELDVPDQRLTTPDEAPPDDTFEASLVPGGLIAFDLAKIRSRENSLFPFLTLDLVFLDRLPRDLAQAQQRMSNPLEAHGGGGANPPLDLSDEALQQLTDRAWSRRDRWKTFAEIAALVGAHHPGRGRAAELIRRYLDLNILQPYCDGDRHDPRFWAMLENAADHADFIDFVRSYTRRYPSSRTTTELLFLVDELVQGSRDVILMVMETRPDDDLAYTRTMMPEAYHLAVAIKERYGQWLFERGMDKRAVRRHYDQLRLRVLHTIVETTPDRYRIADAQFLAGQVLFEMSRTGDAERIWRNMSPAPGAGYYRAAMDILDALGAGTADERTIRRILGNEYGRWRLFSIDRLGQFGHHCDTF